MNKLTAALLALLVLGAVLAERERLADLESIQHIIPLQPAASILPAEPGKVQPPLPVVPADYYLVDPVHVPFHADEMR